MSTATIEKNDVHNYRTADMSDALGHGVHSAIDSLETARSMAHALAEALPDDPDAKVDPDKVRELTNRTIDTWREVKMLTADGEAAQEPFMEQIDLESWLSPSRPTIPNGSRRPPRRPSRRPASCSHSTGKRC